MGRVLASPKSVGYHSEPFNVLDRACLCGARFKHRYTYVSGHNASMYRRHFTHLLSGFSGLNYLEAVRRAVTEKSHQPVKKVLHRLGAERVVVKDPLAVLSAQWMASTFNMKVVVTIRHPAAVVNSYKTLGWTHPFGDFLAQPELMEEHFSPFRSMIEDYARTEQDLVDQAALLWKLVNHMVVKYRAACDGDNDWKFIRYGDLSGSPQRSFDSLFEHVGLDPSHGTREFIAESIREGNPVNAGDPYSIRRNPSKNVNKWKRGLSASEIARVRKIVEGVSEEFYTDDDW